MTLLYVLLAQAGATPSSPDAGFRAGQETLSYLAKLGIDWGARLVGAAVIFVAAWLLAAWVRRWVFRLLDRPRMDQTLTRFLSNAAKWIVIIFALVACLGIFGINTTSVVAIIGATGLAIGLALQGSLSNLAAGVMLLILRPFKVGDVIQTGAFNGKVDDIDLFHTKLDTPDNRRLIIPNSQLFGSVIENITHHSVRRVDVLVGVSHAADIEQTRRLLLDAAQAVAGDLTKQKVQVILMELSPAGVNWQVQAWVPAGDFGAVKDRLLKTIKENLGQARIGPPVQQRELLFTSASPEQLPMVVRTSDQRRSSRSAD